MMREPTASEQDCLKAIHRLGGDEKAVAIREVAARLGVRPPSAAGTLGRLGKAGLVEMRSRSGVSLTPAGLTAARRVIRRHRLVELFLTRVLGFDWSEVDVEADALEHAVSAGVEEALASFLGNPTEDPHGHPIPARNGDLEWRHFTPLNEFRPGQWVLIREAKDEKPQELRRWGDLGLMPGTTVQIRSHDALLDQFHIQVHDVLVPIESNGLKGLLGELAPGL